MPPLVFAGVATLDTIALVDRYPGPDDRVVARDLVRAGGGPAATAAVVAARLGVPTAFVGSVGDDAEGEEIVGGLVAEGVDVSGVTLVEGERSAASLIVVDAGRATRAIVNRPPPAPRVSERARQLVAAAPWLHVDQAGWLAWADRWRAGRGRPALSIDAGNPVPGFSPEGVDLYVPTIRALRRRYGDDLDPEELLDRALAEGARTVVATDGAAGAFARSRQQPFVHVAAAEGPVVSTLGAGDVFHGALLAATHHGLGPVDRLRYANVVAQRSCAGLDGRSAVPGHAETLEALAAPSRR